MLLKKKPKLRTVLKWTLWALLTQLVLGNISAALYAYKFTHFFEKPGDWNVAQPKNVLDKTWKLFKGPAFGKNGDEPLPDFPFINLSFKTKDGDEIDAWYSTVAASKGTVCLFHGLTSNKAYYLPEAWFFREQGRATMCCCLMILQPVASSFFNGPCETFVTLCSRVLKSA